MRCFQPSWRRPANASKTSDRQDAKLAKPLTRKLAKEAGRDIEAPPQCL